MKRTNDYEKKPSQTESFRNPITLNLQTRPFAPIQSEDETQVSGVQAKYTSSGDILQKLISTTPPEKRTPIQRNPFPRLRNQSNPIQAKLNIGEPNDKYEQEADRTAAQVVQQINSSPQEQSVQRSGAIEEEEELQMKSLVQRRENLGGGEASPDLESSIQSARGGGRSLDAGLQESMGQAMGADFSGVKVHTDSQSDQLNQSIQAKAFTTGQDVFFRQGAYDPSSRGGQELIAHELTHVVQQGSGAITAQRTVIQRALTPQNPNWNEAFKVKAIRQGRSNKGIYEISNQGGDTVVAKFTDEKISTANTFGDRVMSTVGLDNPDTVPLTSDKPGFTDVVNAIHSAVGLMRGRGEDNEADDVENLLQQYDPNTVGGLLLMHRVGGVDFGNQMTAQDTRQQNQIRLEAEAMGGDRNFDLIGYVMQPAFIKNLGRLAVADALIGNQDRISAVAQRGGLDATFNGGNFKALANGEIGTFDHDTQLYGRNFLANKTGNNNPDTWFQVMIQGETFATSISERPAPSLGGIFTTAGQNSIYDQMHYVLRASLDDNGRQQFDQQFTFAFFQPNFQKGLQTALVSIAQNASHLRQEAANLQDGENLDPEALEVRLAFIKAKANKVQGLDAQALDLAMNDNTGAEGNAKKVADTLIANRDKLSTKMHRVINYGKANNIINSAHEMTLKVVSGTTSKSLLDDVIEVRPYLDKRMKGDNQRDAKFEELRAKLLKQFVEAYDSEIGATQNVKTKNTQSYRDAVTEAKRITKIFGSIGTMVQGDGGYVAAIWNKYNIQ